MLLLQESAKLIGQGITGSEGSKGLPTMLDYGTQIVAGVTPGKGGQEVLGVPIYNSVKEAQEVCEATITGTNKTTGTVTDTTWGVKIGASPTVYSKKTFNLSNTFSTMSQSGSATVTLTVKGADGVAKSISKIVTIPKRSVTSLGTTCPQ